MSGELKGSAGTTSTAGNDTFKATVATLGSLDVIDGGAGDNTFNLVDSVDVRSLVASVENFKTVNVSTLGAIGKASGSATNAVADTLKIDFGAPVASSTVTFNVGGVETVVSTGADIQATVANTVAGIKAALESQGYTVTATGASTAAQPTVSSSDNTVLISFDNDTAASNTGEIFITGVKTGAELPAVTVKTAGSAASIPAIVAGTGVVGSDGTGAATFSVSAVDGLANANLVAGAEVVARAASTTDIYAEAGGVVALTGGRNVNVGVSIGGATIKSAKGTVSVYEYYNGSVVVEGGTTVTIIKEGSALSTTTGQPSGSAYAGNITVGVDANFGSNPATSTGFPQVDANVAKQPTGDVVVSNYTSYKTLTGASARVYGTGTADVFTNGASSVAVATGGAVTIKDVQVASRIASSGALATPGVSKLASVRIDGTNASGTVTSDALTSLTLVNAGASAAITVTDATPHALALTLGNNTSGSAVTDASATSVVVTTEAQAISSATNASASSTAINAVNATSMTFNNAHAVTLQSAFTNLSKVTSIVATGAGRVTLNDVTAAALLTNIDASAASGGLRATIGSTGSYGLTVKGSSGADTITLKSGATLAAALVNGANVTTSLTLGAGNDTIVDLGATIGAGVTIDGGEGVDTISQSLVNGSNAAVFQNFETLEITGLATAFDGAAMTQSSIQNVALAGGGASVAAQNTRDAEVRNLNTTAATISISQYTDQATSSTDVLLRNLKVTLKDATGTSDSLAVNFAASVTTNGTNDTSRIGTLTQSGIETVTISSGGSTSLDSNYLGSLVDTTNSLKSIVITGAKNFTLGDVDVNTAATTATANVAAALTLIDGSGATGLLTISAGASGSIGASGFSTRYTGLVIKGSDATNSLGTTGDTLTNFATSGVTYGGAGADTINVNGLLQTVYGGTQGDTINVNAGGATVYVGTDAVNAVDTVVVGGISVSSTLANSLSGAAFTSAGTVSSNGYLDASKVTFTSTSLVTTISDLVKGDKIDLTASGLAGAVGATAGSGTVGNLFSALAVDSNGATAGDEVTTPATTLDGLVNQAIADTTNAIDWFVYQGSTYLVINGASVGDSSTVAGSTNANANDYVIKLVGDYTTLLTGVTALDAVASGTASSVLTLG